MRDGLTLPAPGQTLVSRNGREWEVIRVWDNGARLGADVRLKGARPQVRFIYLDRPSGWKLRLPERHHGEWAACPRCGARFGGVTTCAFDGATLVSLDIAGPQKEGGNV